MDRVRREAAVLQPTPFPTFKLPMAGSETGHLPGPEPGRY
ncbi:hypothetical protein X745_05925 [Mesorhizobium sp. LNJC374B00]|nr:hypothetical protein X745_05925 [Mesorhizobium sp. LNJC374B00]